MTYVLPDLLIPIRPRLRVVGGPALMVAMVALSIALPLRTAAAQEPLPPASRDVTNMAVFGTNVLLGGLTASVRALIGGRDPAKAFALGALGGAVHVTGKLVGPISGFPGGVPAVVLSSTGTAIVSNAGRGIGILEELHVPVGPLRVRFTPRAPRRIRLSINAFETAILARSLSRSGMELDWQQSASLGTFVFVTQGKLIRMPDGRLAHGVAWAPTVVISSLADQPRVARHELVHIQQQQFLADALGRPIERYLLARVPGGKHVPRWLELGIVPSAFASIEGVLFGSDGPVRRLAESEAKMLERR